MQLKVLTCWTKPWAHARHFSMLSFVSRWLLEMCLTIVHRNRLVFDQNDTVDKSIFPLKPSRWLLQFPPYTAFNKEWMNHFGCIWFELLLCKLTTSLVPQPFSSVEQQQHKWHSNKNPGLCSNLCLFECICHCRAISLHLRHKLVYLLNDLTLFVQCFLFFPLIRKSVLSITTRRSSSTTETEAAAAAHSLATARCVELNSLHVPLISGWFELTYSPFL